MTDDDIETYEVRAVADALRLAARKAAVEGSSRPDAETARAILRALKLAQARAEERKHKAWREAERRRYANQETPENALAAIRQYNAENPHDQVPLP